MKGRKQGEKEIWKHTQKKQETGKVKAFQFPSTHTERLMMGVYDQAGELLFLGAVKMFTGQQNLIDRYTPPLCKDSS